MTDQTDAGTSEQSRIDNLPERLIRALSGEPQDGILVVETDGRRALDLPDGTATGLAISLGEDLILLQPDGDAIVLLGGMDNRFDLSVAGAPVALREIQTVALERPFGEAGELQLGDDVQALFEDVLGFAPPAPLESIEIAARNVVNPLVGLEISPLLLYTEYGVAPGADEEAGADNSALPPAAITLTVLGEPALSETDSGLAFRPADAVLPVIPDPATGETVTQVGLVMTGLPDGTTVTAGGLTAAADGTLTLVFDGSLAAYEALVITFPADFSTERRSDVPGLAIEATVTAGSNFGTAPGVTVPLGIAAEGDIDIVGLGPATVAETDDSVLVRLADTYLPQATDADGSERVTGITLDLTGLPGGTEYSTDDGATFAQIESDTLRLSLTPAEYAALVLSFPPDFSTENPGTRISGSLTATTDEGGQASVPIAIEVTATPDLTLTAPNTISGAEDARAGDGSGTVVDLGIAAAVTDRDGSEDATLISLTFEDLPLGAYARVAGTDTPIPNGTWTGTIAEARALSLGLPGDYSGTIGVGIVATSPEGRVTTFQTVTIVPTGDVDLDIIDPALAETDAPVSFAPATVWRAETSDADGSEVIANVRLGLVNLPVGVTFSGVPAASVTFDGTTGDFVFAGTPAEYAALTLVFPADFSTTSRGDGRGPVSGTLSVMSNEGNSSADVGLTIAARDDLDFVGPGTLTVVETDAPLDIIPSAVLRPIQTDADGSEAVDLVEFTLPGLPAGTEISFDGGATFGPVGGSALNFSGTLADYEGLVIRLPADFSTTNPGTPLTATLRATTDEGGDEIRTVSLVVTSSEDIDLTIPAVVQAQEDGGATNSARGVIVDPVLDIAVTDRDGSEDAATVTIDFTDLPAGAYVRINGADTPIIGGRWTGSVAEANDLQLGLPGNYSGTVGLGITVETPEGVETARQDVVVAPVPDVEISGSVRVSENDPDPASTGLEIRLSDFIAVVITDPDETLISVRFDLAGLPLGTQLVDGTGTTYNGFLTPNGGGLDLSYLYVQGSSPEAPGDLRLILPDDYSTESPSQSLTAVLDVVTTGGTTRGTVPFVVTAEGDVDLRGAGVIALAETDAPVAFRPADALRGVPTDADGSESLSTYTVSIADLPTGTRISTDNGASFTVLAPTPGRATVDFLATLTPSDYDALVVELPADFSTAGSDLRGTVTVSTDEAAVVNGTATGVATRPFAISVSPEGDVALTTETDLSFTENDGPTNDDRDATTTAPVVFAPRDALLASPTDADGSERIVAVDVAISGLPAGTLISRDGGITFAPAAGATFTAGGITLAQYDALRFRLPDDFATDSPPSAISGSATFVTNEGGSVSGRFAVTVAAEADVRITATDVVATEDQATPIDLGLAAAVTDPDGSEVLTAVTVTFAGLPERGDVILSDGSNTYTLNAGNASLTVSPADLAALAITALPTHFSGILSGTVSAVTTEGGPVTARFDVRIAPVAEPVIALSVDASEPQVALVAPDRFSVKEDTSFLLKISAATPDTADGSEALTRVVIENVPPGWLPQGTVLPHFESGFTEITSAILTGTTLTITLRPGSTSVTAGVRLRPTPDGDGDVSTLQGADLRATVTAVDGAAGLPTDLRTASDGTDVDVDAVVDGINLATRNVTVNENTTGRRNAAVRIDTLSLRDADGSEAFDRLELTLRVRSAADDFDLTDATHSDAVRLLITGGSASNVILTETGRTTDTISFLLSPAAGASSGTFAAALQRLNVNVTQHFSGIVETAGEVFWSETRTGDGEVDLTDNFASQSFATQITVRPVAEADMTFAAFVRTPGDVATASPNRVEGTVRDGSATVANVLTLLESTEDGSGPGQVDLFLQLDLDTPDKDGSEQLTSLTIENVPTDWLSGVLSGSLIRPEAFFTPDGSAGLGAAEWAKVNVAIYDVTTGTVTLLFVPGTTDFAGSLRLQPTLYEDYDVNPGRDYANPAADPALDADGLFFGGDLKATLRTSDTNTVTTDIEDADVTLDVDVDPVNNPARIPSLPVAREDAVDAAGGIVQIPLFPVIPDQDGSETITAILIRNLDARYVPYAADPDAPGGPKVPVALQAINRDGTNDWSMGIGPDPSNPLWQSLELRGVERHFAGDIPLQFEIVTTERDGRGIGISRQTVAVRIEPVPDGGNPSETVATFEDVAVAITIDGNIIDNRTTSPGSPESLIDSLTISGIVPDADGRVPRFFTGAPVADPANPGGYLNELLPTASGVLIVTPLATADLHILPPEDSNRDISLPIEVTYREDIDPGQARTGTGTLTVRVTGIADRPTATVQDRDPANAPGGLEPAAIHPDFRPGDDLQPGPADDGGMPNGTRAYAYAGYEGTSFALDKRVSDAVLQTGLPPGRGNNIFADADPLGGTRTETSAPTPGQPDGSETIYYLISGFDPSVQVIGASPADITGTAYLVTESQLAGLRINALDTTGGKVAYHDLSLSVIVQEDDASIPDLRGLSPEQRLAALDGLDGVSVAERDFSLMILEVRGGGGGPGGVTFPPGSPKDIGLPSLSLTGSGNEDEPIALTLELLPSGAYHDLKDLLNLPRGVLGSLSVSIDLPEGASLIGATPGTVLYNPFTGQYILDLAKLIQPGDKTTSSGGLFYVPPPNQSSPINPFDPSETFGANDPHDGLADLSVAVTLQNVNLRTVETTTVTSSISVAPVADGPSITLADPGTVFEDTSFELGASIGGQDGGERLAPGVPILVGVDARNGGRLLDAGGATLTPVGTGADGFAVYEVTPAELPTVRIAPGSYYSGPLTYRVTATSQDIDGSTAPATQSRTVQIQAVANTPDFTSGVPGPTPLYTAVEDQPFNLSTVLQAASPDRDGSEVTTFVQLGVPSYLDVLPGPGITNNGDGSYTILPSAFASLRLQLKDAHARTPDALDPAIPAQIPLALGLNVLELSNGSTAQLRFDFLLQILPDADLPTLSNARVATPSVDEDSPIPVLVTLEATTPDPHETLDFVIANLPPGTVVTLGGVAVPVTVGAVTIAGVATSGAGVGPMVFAPAGPVAITPPPDFAGAIDIDVFARTTDAGAGVVDTAVSGTTTLQLTVAATPDLSVTVLDPADRIAETDADIAYVPSSNITLDVTDRDGSEVITSIVYTLSGLPPTAALGAGSTGATLTGGRLSFSGTEAAFDALSIVLPADYSTSGSPDIAGSITVTTNERGVATRTFTLAIDGELDLALSVTPADLVQTGDPFEIPLGIRPTITDTQTVPTETLDEVVVTFDSPLALDLTPTAPEPVLLSADRQTLTMTRQVGTSSSEFTAAVGLLTLASTGAFVGTVNGSVAARTSDGTLPGAVPFSVTVNDRPEVSGSVDLGQQADTTFAVPVSQLLSTTTDRDMSQVTVSNITTSDPAVSALLGATEVTFTVTEDFKGQVDLSFDVVDGASPSATAQGQATVDIVNLVALGATGEMTSAPDGSGSYLLLGDATGLVDQTDIAVGTDGHDAVSYHDLVGQGVPGPFAGIDGFRLEGGNDLIDLSGASHAFAIDGGDGDDWLLGGDGADRLTGGAGRDRFDAGATLPALPDVITDYERGEVIDLSRILELRSGESAADRVDLRSGTLSMTDTSGTVHDLFTIMDNGGGVPDSVTIAFEDAASIQQTAVV